ncbi:MAG: ATP-binding protein [Actinomycetales bacterium]
MSRPVTIRLRLFSLLGSLIILMLLVGVAGVAVLTQISTDVQRLTLGLTPANDVNTEVRVHLERADAALIQWEGSATTALADLARAQCAEAEVRQTRITATVDSPELTSLTVDQARAVAEYCTDLNATLAGQAPHPDPIPALAATDAVAGWIGESREEAREQVREFNTYGRIGLVVATLIAVSVALLGAQRTVRWVLDPLRHVVEVLERLRTGQTAARAELVGGREAQTVAAAVNALADEADRFRQAQDRAGELRQDVQSAHLQIMGELEPDGVLAAAAAALGRALRVQRVWIRQVDQGRPGALRAQWQVDGLAPITDAVFVGTWPGEPMLPPCGRLQPTGGPSASWGQLGDEVRCLETVVNAPCLANDCGRRLLLLTEATALVQAAINGPESTLAGVWLAETAGPRAFTVDELTAVATICREVGQALTQAEVFATQAELVDRLQDLDRQKDDFVSTVTHELRTPLASILGYTEAILDGDGGELPDHASAMLTVVHRNGRRLLELIEDLLTLARMGAGKPAALPGASADVARVVDSVITSLQPSAQGAALYLRVHDAAPGARVAMDPASLERVLSNLVSNALKFTLAGGVSVEVGADEGSVTVAVTDTGIGIGTAESEQLFTRFYRAPNAVAAAIPGTGLGLAIVQEIVHAHQGRIWVSSTPDVGTTVRFRLPLAAHEDHP